MSESTELIKYDWTARFVAFSGSMQVRFSHTDISTPDYSFYKRKGVQDVKVSQEATAPQRRMFTYVMVGGKKYQYCLYHYLKWYISKKPFVWHNDTCTCM